MKDNYRSMEFYTKKSMNFYTQILEELIDKYIDAEISLLQVQNIINDRAVENGRNKISISAVRNMTEEAIKSTPERKERYERNVRKGLRETKNKVTNFHRMLIKEFIQNIMDKVINGEIIFREALEVINSKATEAGEKRLTGRDVKNLLEEELGNSPRLYQFYRALERNRTRNSKQENLETRNNAQEEKQERPKEVRLTAEYYEEELITIKEQPDGGEWDDER